MDSKVGFVSRKRGKRKGDTRLCDPVSLGVFVDFNFVSLFNSQDESIIS